MAAQAKAAADAHDALILQWGLIHPSFLLSEGFVYKKHEINIYISSTFFSREMP